MKEFLRTTCDQRSHACILTFYSEQGYELVETHGHGLTITLLFSREQRLSREDAWERLPKWFRDEVEKQRREREEED